MSNAFETKGKVAGFYRWRPGAWLRVSGPDAANFLQGQFTQDLRELDQEPAAYGLWLNHKGRVLADSFVLKNGDQSFWVGSYFSPATVIKERLEAFIIADDVTVEDQTLDWHGRTVFGGNASIIPRIEGKGVSFPGRRMLNVHREYVFPESEAATSSSLISMGEEWTFETMEAVRIGAKIPAIPFDLGPGELPNEGGLELAAISYTKGCYLGQEVMARLKSMGQVRRRLVKVNGAGKAPPLPAPLFQGETRIGELRTAANVDTGFVGLALVSLLNAKWEQAASWAPGAERTLTLEAPSS